MSMFCKIEDLINESDVEQKLIAPMLISDKPTGLGYSESDYKTKIDIRKISIGKGKSKKLYFPDYVILINGIPTLIIEAKNPDENLQEAVKEARLYASEINAEYENGVNLCSKIIVTNGKEIWCNYWDSDSSIIKVKFDDINKSSESFNDFIKFASKQDNLALWEKNYQRIRGGRKFIRPINLLGGREVREEEKKHNNFGEQLTIKYKDLFNPSSYDDKKIIAESAYIQSDNIKSHKSSIDKIIRAAQPASVTNSIKIGNTINPKEIFNALRNKKKCKGEIMLLIGNVGSGKSTFTVHVREVSLPKELKEKTMWLSLDLNNAPASKEEIYKWVKDKIISEIKIAHEDFDFDNIDNIKKIYGNKINKLDKKLKGLVGDDQNFIKKELAKKIIALEDDIDYNVKTYIDYFCNSRDKLLVITLDNCDKRSKDTQLLMFEVANWIKSEYECLVLLPMRDVTYDHHKKEPPLDTIIKDLIFRIDPPSLPEVLYRRVRFIIGYDRSPLVFNLTNGTKVTFAQKDQEAFFKSMLKSLFENKLFRRMVSGLAGRDIRRGIEIFLDFCRSGYIEEGDYVQITYSNGEYSLKPHKIMRVLIRGNRKYYIDDNSNIRNLFKTFPDDTNPNPFSRLSILRWLKNKCKEKGPNGTRGYHKISKLLASLKIFGHEEDRIIQEIKTLITARIILTESLVVNDKNELLVEEINQDDLISISPAGHIHLELLTNLEYLSSCAEDVWYRDAKVAEKIRERITKMPGSYPAIVDNSKDLIEYLEDYKKILNFKPEVFLNDEVVENLINLDDSKSKIEKTNEQITAKKIDHKKGQIFKGKIINIFSKGCFVEIPSTHGFLSTKGLDPKDLHINKVLDVEIIDYDEDRKKYTFKIPQ